MVGIHAASENTFISVFIHVETQKFLMIYQNFGINQKHYFKTSDNKLGHGLSCMHSEKNIGLI